MLRSKFKKEKQREKKPSLLDEVNLLKYMCGNTKKKKEIFTFPKYCAFKWISQL